MSRLRKHLKTRRVTAISQVGTDRIIEFQFSDGLYRLYFEFYAGGNIVLTDGDLKILALLRNVDEGAEHERLRVGLVYNLSLRQNYGGIPELTKERLRQALQKAVDKQQEPAAEGKKTKKQGKDALRKALAVSITECAPLLVDHSLHNAKFDSTLKPEQVLQDETLLDNLLAILLDARKTSDSITDPDPVKGYILTKSNPQPEKSETDGAEKPALLYNDFHPFKPQQFVDSGCAFLEFDGFNKAVDEYFSSIEGQKLESKLHERELHAKKKLDQARQQHANRIGDLQNVQELQFRKAEAILANVHRVKEVIDAVNGLIGQGMDWGEIARLIEREKTQGNAVAQLIKLPLKLYENTVTLELDEAQPQDGGFDEDEDYETSSVSEDSGDEDDRPSKTTAKASKSAPSSKLAIDIDLGLSAWANSSEYFDQKKSAAGKEERTADASEKALRSQQQKIANELKKGLKQEKEVLRPVRKQHWFEKFIYFISSDGYLVLGGKDAQQNEILYKRYLHKGDVYVHADLKGAVPMIIKNKPNTPDAPIPPSTLSQAGHLSVSTSEAWDSKAGMSAWWVNSDQVSKTGQTGEYLAPGLFNIKGKKEFLPPAQLIVGLAVMFEISEESKARHQKHRLLEPETPALFASGSVQDASRPEIVEKQDSGSESDEDFPDAKLGSASDDEFPDAKLEEDSEASDKEDFAPQRNPLQSSAAGNAEDSDSDFDSDANKKDSQPSKAERDIGEAGQDSGSTKTSSNKRHLSARERRLLRKGQIPENDQTPSGAQALPDDSESTVNVSSQPSGTDTPNRGPPTITSKASKAGGTGALPRGKRGKAKKVAAKYAEQDEEERALAMRLLGSSSGQKAKEDDAQAKRAKEEEALANKQRRREQHLRAQEAGKAAEEARKTVHESNLADDGGEDDETLKSQLLEIEALTGRPLPGDEIISAIPVCAPWSALATYKYKVKMQPGAVKRGKAVKEVMMRWDAAGKDPRALDKFSKDVERVWPKEIELIRGWKEAEVVGALPVSKVRIMMAGGNSGGGSGGGAKKSRGGRGSKKR